MSFFKKTLGLACVLNCFLWLVPSKILGSNFYIKMFFVKETSDDENFTHAVDDENFTHAVLLSTLAKDNEIVRLFGGERTFNSFFDIIFQSYGYGQECDNALKYISLFHNRDTKQNELGWLSGTGVSGSFLYLVNYTNHDGVLKFNGGILKFENEAVIESPLVAIAFDQRSKKILARFDSDVENPFVYFGVYKK
jgi:hypothetical protein